MIIQKVDKKKMYINIAVLAIVLILIIYLLLSNMSPSKKDTKNSKGVVDEPLVQSVILKYGDIKKIDLSILDDDRYKNLRLVNNGLHPDLEKGNSYPFKKE